MVYEEWKERGLYCLDDLPAQTLIGGIQRGQLHIIYAPCNLNREEMGAKPTEDCIPDLT